MILLGNESFAEVQTLPGKSVAEVFQIHKLHVSEASLPTNRLWHIQGNILASSHFVCYTEDSSGISRDAHAQESIRKR